MPQVFPRWFDAIARVGIVSGVLAIPGVAMGLALFYRSDYVTGARTAYEQPVPFSHQHHTGQLGLDCRYCHASSEDSAFAGMPPTETCMNCHQQIWVGAETLEPVRASWKRDEPIRWKRVHNLPDFVYFHHGAHVSKGVGCVECHGRMDRMPLTWQVAPLTMGWCIDCHRDPGPHLRPRDEVYNLTWTPDDPHASETTTSTADARPPRDASAHALLEAYGVAGPRKLTSCSTCHR